jgi:carboxylesterase
MSTLPAVNHVFSAPRKPVVGALLVHGLNGSRSDMQELHEYLLVHGILSENMLLPGHGTHVRDMLSLGWSEWAQAVQHELQVLKQRCNLVFLVGHSLGGALCLHVSAHEEVTGIVAMCAPLYLYPWLEPIVGLAKRFTPLLPSLREDVRDPVARRRYTRDVYHWTPIAPVHSLMQFLPQLRTELPGVTAPALIMVAIHDHVVPASDGQAIYRLIGSHHKDLVTFHHSYHVIMKDYEREEVFEKTLAFIQRHTQRSTVYHHPFAVGGMSS